MTGLIPNAAYAQQNRMSSEDIRAVLRDGVFFLTTAQEESGHFQYEYLPYEGRYRNDDNIVRQAGAFFQLSEIKRYDQRSRFHLHTQLRLSAEYFRRLSVEGSMEDHSFRCIKETSRQSCKLGATALALIGMLNMTEAYPMLERKYEDLIQEYAAYLIAMKKEGAGFRYYFNPQRIAQRGDESSFSTGEAFFALARFEQRFPSEENRRILNDTFEYVRTIPFDAPLFLWVMAGIRDLPQEMKTDAHVAYADAYTRWRLADNDRYRASTQNRCAYIEGLASAHTVLQGYASEEFLRQVHTTIEQMLYVTSFLQIDHTEPIRYIFSHDGGEWLRAVEPLRAHGGFLTGTERQEMTERIDYTQHCLSAYLQTLVDIRGASL